MCFTVCLLGVLHVHLFSSSVMLHSYVCTTGEKGSLASWKLNLGSVSASSSCPPSEFLSNGCPTSTCFMLQPRQGWFQLLAQQNLFFFALLIYNKISLKKEGEQALFQLFFLSVLRGLQLARPACCEGYFWLWFSFPGSSGGTGRIPVWKISPNQMLVNLWLGILRTQTRSTTCWRVKHRLIEVWCLIRLHYKVFLTSVRFGFSRGHSSSDPIQKKAEQKHIHKTG